MRTLLTERYAACLLNVLGRSVIIMPGVFDVLDVLLRAVYLVEVGVLRSWRRSRHSAETYLREVGHGVSVDSMTKRLSGPTNARYGLARLIICEYGPPSRTG